MTERWPEVRAALVAAAMLFLLVMGAPGLDYLAGEPRRADGPVWSAMLQLHASVRAPLVDPFYEWERRVGMRQQWHFYGTGASRCRRFEVLVDGELWHQSNSSEHRFLMAQLDNPRVRHIVKNWVKRKSGWATGPLFKMIADAVLAVDPDAQTIEMRGREGRWPGKKMETVRTVTGSAPDWRLR